MDSRVVQRVVVFIVDLNADVMGQGNVRQFSAQAYRPYSEIQQEQIFSLTPRPPSKSVILKKDLLLVFKKVVLFWIQKASVNMTAGFSFKNRHIEDDLILVLKKQTPTVKVNTVRLKVQ
jgi:hypothetical protein